VLKAFAGYAWQARRSLEISLISFLGEASLSALESGKPHLFAVLEASLRGDHSRENLLMVYKEWLTCLSGSG